MTAPLRLQVIHEVPGRMRLRCPGLRGEPGLSAAVEALARALPGFPELSIRPVTESVVFCYSPEDADPAAFRSALEARAELGLPDRTEARRTGSGPVGAQLIRQVRRWWNEADREVLRVTGGTFDLGTSVPWVLLFLALRQLAINGSLPALPWYTALYYSLQAILRHSDDVETSNQWGDGGEVFPPEGSDSA